MRHWQSSSSNTKIFLSVRSARGVGKGRGLFQTLIPVHFQPDSKDKALLSQFQCQPSSGQRKQRLPKNSPIHPISSSDNAALAAKFVAYLEQVDRDQTRCSALGSWMDSIPSRIGHSTVLDNAAACLIDGYNSFRHKHNQYFTKAAHRSYARNLAELRKALLDPNEVGRSETIASVKLLTAFEVGLMVQDCSLAKNPTRYSWVIAYLHGSLTAAGSPRYLLRGDLKHILTISAERCTTALTCRLSVSSMPQHLHIHS